VDWTPWQDYVELLNPKWKLPRKRTQATKEKKQEHFWKSLDHSSDPELVQVEATVPTTLGGGVLECGYALDQDDNVIGFVYGTKPSEAAKAAEVSGDKDKSGETVTMTVRILPDVTRHVVFAASYTHVDEEKRKKNEASGDTKDAKDDDSIESHVYKSRPISLDVVADRNTKINVAAA
jgi:hypothetical protein